MSAEVIALLHKAIALLSGTVNEPAAQQPATPAQAAQYLRENPDVAAHAYYGTRPLEHWHMHGRAEGRKWPTLSAPAAKAEPVTHPAWTDPGDTVMTPRGRSFPRPHPELGEMFMAYTVRVGEAMGVKQLAINIQGTLRDAGTPLFAKHGGFKADGSNWAAAAEDWLFPVTVPADPGWQQVYDRMQEQRVPVAQPPDETPL